MPIVLPSPTGPVPATSARPEGLSPPAPQAAPTPQPDPPRRRKSPDSHADAQTALGARNLEPVEEQPPGPRDAAVESRRPGAEIRDLAPRAVAPAPEDRYDAYGDTSRAERRLTRPARVSIGTIEVTVVSAPEPAAPTHPVAAPAPQARRRPRPPSQLAAGADRLREGRRRWYGTAQG
jgi:hypothetical protein